MVPTEASLQVVRCARGEVGPASIRGGRRSAELGPVGALTFVFDPVKLAVSLTNATGIPYYSQHLPITVIRFVKNDSAICRYPCRFDGPPGRMLQTLAVARSG